MNNELIYKSTLTNSRIFQILVWAVAALSLVIAVSLYPGVHFGTDGHDQGDFGFTASTGANAIVQAQTNWGQMPLYFVANQGQMHPRVTFYVQGRDKMLYFTDEGVTFALISPLPDWRGGGGEVSSRWIIRLDFVDAHPVRPIGQSQTGAVVSYFKGPRDEWHTGLPTYARIIYRDLWEGIDLAYSGTVNQLKYEFIVQPGADPARIRLAYRGASVRLNEAGQLEVSTPAGGFQDDAPLAYQEVDGQRVPVQVAFRVLETANANLQSEIENRKSEIGFRLGAYDPTLPLVIDPAVLVYCGYIGGSGDDSGNGIAVDTAGNAYITGSTASTQATFPLAVGPDLTYNGGDRDVFVAKVNADGTGLVYAGYIGGNAWDRGDGIAVDSWGNAYVTGVTESTEVTFPITLGPDLSHNGKHDAFVAKVNVSGTALVYAGYIGGSEWDFGMGITVDTAGNAYITGYTASTEATFPVTVGPDISYNGGARDAFVAKVNVSGTGLVYAGYIGGSDRDISNGIALDTAGNVYITGYTASTQATFPVTVGPDLTYNGGLTDAFVVKVNASGTALVYCGYIGGSSDDFGKSIAVDTAGNAYVTGSTNSTEAAFPVTVGPDTTYNGGSTDAFVSKVNANGTALVYCGYIGGSEWDLSDSIVVDAAGNAYVTGSTNSTEVTFPVAVGPDLTYNGSNDAFVTNVNVSGTALAYSGFIGGSGKDEGYGIAVDPAGNAYVTGATASTQASFPATVGPDLTHNGVLDAFVAKVSIVPLDFKVYLPLIAK
ncbi:MAG: SBBP repeat-containing protein [Chloroflexota bacterium]